MPSIQLKHLSKSYDNHEKVLSDINLTINDKEFFVLVGPSGCGKSTLLRMIAGLETVQDGDVYIGDRNVSQLPPQDHKISMVFQSYALFPHLSVRENILFGLEDKKISKIELEERLNEAVKLTSLEKYVDRKPKNLSGGQRQRVALARAIASKRKVCLMDEPLSNLDAELREKMRTQIKELQRNLGMTIIYVTHDQTEAMTMGDRIAVLNGGEIQQVGTPLEVYNNPVNQFVAGFIGTPKMNFLALTRTENALISNNYDVNIPLTVSQATALSGQNSVDVGIRPEHLKLSEVINSQLTGTVINVEQLGNETIVVFDCLEHKMIAKLKGQQLFVLGQKVYFEVDLMNMHLFEHTTQRRILAAFEEVSVAEGCVG
ncbi:ABC transporter ATP-binding protein [Periweissella fabaria]|uniref:Maltose/maltodextrin import ATP-binding protein MalK n=1 Tax=Periweissella fabaria TaxID=546157 RepID=A0ABM8Z5S4_9LACO|nr:ABC transporter ATP-binding protein [Periweissella fabaria]MCM0596837.1 ABC transporter ATP-binding protein [Periweissella fabaria]CAH0416574.1 Maltose/maltodextrin import ATP-binding protein MalK [Periweissella fabaria]